MDTDISEKKTLRPLLKDPMVELTQYRDQHFKVVNLST